MSKKKKHHSIIFSENTEENGVSQKPRFAIQLFEYNKDKLTETKDFDHCKFEAFTSDQMVSWLNIHGIDNPQPIEIICAKLGIHDLVLEDILDTNQRPKLQEYDNYLQFSVKSVVPGADNELLVEQISFVLGNNYLLSFQERPGEYFKDIRFRLRQSKGIIRERSADYLLFHLLDAVLNNYFKSIEVIEEKIVQLIKLNVDSELHPNTIFQIENLKTDVLLLKKLIEPLKTAILNIENDQEFIQKSHMKYFNELVDQCNQLLDETNTLYHQLESAKNLFFSLQGYKMNQIMKTLTIIATIFIPLTFIVGVYGMNFDYMPELRYKWGYFGVWGFMIIGIIIMIVYFKRKKWF